MRSRVAGGLKFEFVFRMRQSTEVRRDGRRGCTPHTQRTPYMLSTEVLKGYCMMESNAAGKRRMPIPLPGPRRPRKDDDVTGAGSQSTPSVPSTKFMVPRSKHAPARPPQVIEISKDPAPRPKPSKARPSKPSQARQARPSTKPSQATQHLREGSQGLDVSTQEDRQRQGYTQSRSS